MLATISRPISTLMLLWLLAIYVATSTRDYWHGYVPEVGCCHWEDAEALGRRVDVRGALIGGVACLAGCSNHVCVCAAHLCMIERMRPLMPA